MKISFVVAVAKNGVMGSHNALPFYIPDDLKHFKQITVGHTVLMGKNTFDSIMKRLGHPLPDRRNVVITHQKDYQAPEGVLVFHDLYEALTALSKDTQELMVAGGGQIYKQLVEMGKVNKIYMTHVHKEVDGDVMFPEIDWGQWIKINEEVHEDFTWTDYERID